MKFTREQEEILLDENANPVDRANAMWCMESDRVRRHDELVISFLGHANFCARAHALSLLLSWGLFEYVPMAIDWLRNDPLPDVRCIMAHCLSSVAWALPDRTDEIVSILVERIVEDRDSIAAGAAYEAALWALGYPMPMANHEHFDPETDVDWKRLGRYRGRPRRGRELLS